jgi:very-short-patch-repair endonuclease
MAERVYKYAPKSAIERARRLRSTSTDAEAIMWAGLRGRSLRARFRRQHPFEGYFLDFYCHEARLAVEVDGGQHYEAGHARRDAQRTRVLARGGLHVLRFTNLEVIEELDSVLESVWFELRRRLPSP